MGEFGVDELDWPAQIPDLNLRENYMYYMCYFYTATYTIKLNLLNLKALIITWQMFAQS